MTALGWAFACLVVFLAGAVKGLVGFAMPMLMLSGLSSMLAPEAALAALILPTLVTNLWQGLRYGWADALAAVRQFRAFLIAGGVAMALSAQLVRAIPTDMLLCAIGALILMFSLSQLLGWTLRPMAPSVRVEAGIGAVAGFVGGLSGVWGPPTVAYLTAVGTQKAEQIRIQGVIFAMGSLLLAAAHLRSGILGPETLGLSVLMVFPALLGMALGLRWNDRIDQASFKRATLLVLAFAGFNLIRRGLFG